MVLSKFKNLFKTGLKGKGYRLGENPSIDWVLALGCFFLLTVLGIFFTISNSPSPSASVDSAVSGPQVFSQEVLDRVITRYEEKQRQFDSLLENPPTLADPSI